MKLKDKIKSKWSLESKDNYEPIKRQVCFNNPVDSFRKRILFKGILTSIASVVFICLLVGLTMKYGHKWSGDVQSPGGYDGVDGENTAPIEPGEENTSSYLDCIEKLEKLEFDSLLNYSMIYFSYAPTINGSSAGRDKIVNVIKIVKVLNELSYEEVTVSENEFNYKLVVNNGWCNIHFDENEYLALEYENEYHIYKTDCSNIYEAFIEFIK